MRRGVTIIRVLATYGALLACIGYAFSQSNSAGPFFRHLTVEDGLSNNWVKSILKDDRGFMWFGTYNGLNRYDGRQFKAFRSDTLTHLSDNVIESLAEDSRGRIWVGTFSGGLNLYDPNTESFTTYRHDPSDPYSLSGNTVYAIFNDKEGRLWVGTDNGLNLFDEATSTFTRYLHRPGDSRSITPGLVSCILQDHDGILWIGTRSGLNAFDPAQGSFQRFTHINGNESTLSENYVKSIYEDKYGDLWVGTWGGGLDKLLPEGHFLHFNTDNSDLSNNTILNVTGDDDKHIYVATEGGGLNILDITSGRFKAYRPSLVDGRGINSNSIHTLYFDDRGGMLWVGTYNGGINFFSKWDKPFELYQARLNGLNNNHVTCVDEDREGRIWIGTDGSGVNVFNREGDFDYYAANGINERSLQSDAILSIMCDDDGNVWVGSYNGGLDLISSRGTVTAHFKHDPNDPFSVSDNNISALYKDKRGNLWVGTMTGGLNLFDPASKTFTSFKHDPADPNSIIDNFIYGILEDRLGRLLIQTGKGLDVFDHKELTFSRFNSIDGTHFGVPLALLEDSQGNLWVGSQEQGLFRVDRTGVTVTSYTVPDGLPSNTIAGILEDEGGNLWISTARGLCQLEEGVVKPERVRFHMYTSYDGLQGSEFKVGAYCKLRDGRMVFAGQNGFNVFDPIKVRVNPTGPSVVFTNIKLFNKDVDFHNSPILDKPITETDAIELKHDQSVVTFEFAGLDYVLSDKNSYAYTMDGFEENWNYVGTRNTATYSNLDPGSYTFKVRAANNDGIWNDDVAELRITVVPPWWETPLFRVSLALFLILALLVYYRIRTNALKRSKKYLEEQVALSTADLKKASAEIEARQREILRQNDILIGKNRELESQSSEIKRMAEEIRDLNEAKIRFFTNISHELRTPLNLILWPLEDLLSDSEFQIQERKSKYGLMHKNATKLTKLINQLLDFSRIESGTFKLDLEKKDLIRSIADICDTFTSWARKNNIDFRFEHEAKSASYYFDEDKLEKILSNLLSNAFKFVDEGGQVLVIANIIQEEGPGDEQVLQIEVRDNGKGISMEQLDLIFKRFYEGRSSRFPGSGIGLSLVKELVELHGGRVWVESTENVGSSFYFRIPVHKTFEKKPDPEVVFTDNDPSDEHTPAIAPAATDDPGHLSDRPNILIVEDNPEILAIMRDKLSLEYHVTTALNATAGLSVARKEYPDLIITDVMMPGMDGFEFCERLKSDEQTRHIPVLLVTALSEYENQIKGLNSGAHDYIHKPFHFDLLKLKVRNLLFERAQLKEQFIKSAGASNDKPGLSSDEQFMIRCATLVHEHMKDGNFSVEDLSHSLGMSRRNVLRKMKALTGLSINEFIRNTRLDESLRLLKTGDLNVSEVAYSVGFTDPKYFTSCFKRKFGTLPSDVRTSTSSS